MARENVGAIYYTVEADTASLVKGGAAGEATLDKLEKQFKRTDKSANDATFKLNKTAAAVKGLGRQSSIAQAALGSLSGVLSGILTIRTAAAIIQTAEAYGEMAERVRMASKDAREYNMVQARLLDTANNTYRSLSEAQEVYIRTADTLRSMGYTTSEVLDITDSLSYLFVTNASSAERAEGAISAYSKAMSKGKVEADAWETILAATPSIIGDIAAATKLSESEIRRLGASGKLTADQLNKGLSQSLEKNREAAAGMATTVKDAFTALRNNIAVYLGETNQATGATGMLSSAILKIADAVKNSSVEQLAQEIESLKLSMEALADLASDWLGPFMKHTSEAADLLPTSFSRAVLSTAKELDGLASFFTGVVGAIENVWSALTANIPAFFNNAWNEVLTDSAAFVNKLADIINKPIQAFGGKGIGKVDFGGGATEAIINLTDAAREGWDQASKSLGLYDKALRRITDGTILRSAAAAETEYGETIATTNKRKKEDVQLTDAQKKAIKEAAKAREENRKVLDKYAESLMQAGIKGEELAVIQAKAQLNKFATPEDIANVEALARAIYQVTQAEENRKLLAKMDPIANEQMSFEEEIANLQKLNEAKLLEDQRYLELKAQAEVAHDEKMRQLQEENFRRQSTWNDLLMGSIDRVGDAITDNFIGIVTGAANGEDAIRNLAGAILQDAVGALVQMGVEALKNLIISKTVGAAATAAGVSEAGILAAAWAAPAALASLASFGANAAPANAALVSTVGVAKALSIAGGRRYGGDVQAGKMYRINENGAPEVYNASNGQQYMLPTRSGKVISNEDATRGATLGANVTVNLIQDRERAGQVTQNTSDDGVEVNAFVADIYGGGERSQAMEQVYGLRRIGN